MFRDTQRTELSVKNFGAGSILSEGRSAKYMVVVEGNSVRLLSLYTFELLPKIVSVEDPNFISQDECRDLVSMFNSTFSDFDFDPKGQKK